MKHTTLCMTKQVSSDERHIPLIPSTSCTTSLISLQQMDSNYRYPVNYYYVDNMIIRKQWLHSKNARANKSGTRHIKMVCSYRLQNRLGLIYGPTHDLRTGPNGPRILRTRVLKVITLEISFSVTFHCVKADEKHPNWFFGELF